MHFQLALSHPFELGEVAGPDLAPAVARVLPDDAAIAYLLADPVRRHAWNIVLINRETADEQALAAGLSELEPLLMRAPTRQLLKEAFGESRAGMMQPVLKLLPEQSLSRGGYRCLVAVIAKAHTAGIDLKQFGPLNEAKLIVLAALDSELWQPRAIKTITDHNTALTLVELVRYIGAIGDARSKIIAALNKFNCWANIADLFEQILDNIEPPAFSVFQSDDQCIFLNDVSAMRDAARRFDPTLVREIAAVLAGRKRFAIWNRYRRPLLVGLAREGAIGWRIYKIWGCRGRSPRRDERLAIRSYFATKNIAERGSLSRIADEIEYF